MLSRLSSSGYVFSFFVFLFLSYRLWGGMRRVMSKRWLMLRDWVTHPVGS